MLRGGGLCSRLSLLVGEKTMTSRTALSILAMGMALSVPAVAKAAQCTIDAKASGSFGTPTSGASLPLVQCFHANSRGTIIVKVSGSQTWDFGAGSVGPKGICYSDPPSIQIPLQEGAGVGGGSRCAQGAVIAAFVPEATANSAGFSPVDNTKNQSLIGIAPSALFFVGTYTAFEAPGPGYVYLGINDGIVDDNTGSVTAQVSKPF